MSDRDDEALVDAVVVLRRDRLAARASCFAIMLLPVQRQQRILYAGLWRIVEVDW